MYCGAALLEGEELKESNSTDKIEIEYYSTKNNTENSLKEDMSVYGIEVIKKEYRNQKIRIEKTNVDNVADSSLKVIEIINTLKNNKVTPIGLQDVLEDLQKQRITE